MNEINYLNLPAIYGAAANIQSAKINSRLDAMKMAEYEKELAKRENRNALAKNYFSGGSPEQNLQPQMTPAPAQSFTGNALAAPEYSAQPNVNIPATAPKQDYTGYANALMGSGDVEGGMAVMKSADEQKKHALDVTKATVDIANTMSQMDERQRTAGLKNLELIGNAAAGVLSEYEKLVNSGMPDGMARQQIQPLYEQTKSSLENAGVKLQNASPVFNPDEARSAVSLVLGVKDRMKENTTLPYKKGERQKFTGKDGSEYEGTFKGLDTTGSPQFTDVVKVKKESPLNTDFRNESAMRKEFLDLPEVKQYPTIEQQAGRAIRALSDKSGSKIAVDQAVITTFNKMLDPSSVVRESEYARTPQDMALLNRIKGKWEKIQSGGAGLTDDERQALSRMMTAFKDVADQQYNEQVDYYSGLAQRYGYKPENIVRLGGKRAGGPSSPAPQAQAASTPHKLDKFLK